MLLKLFLLLLKKNYHTTDKEENLPASYAAS